MLGGTVFTVLGPDVIVEAMKSPAGVMEFHDANMELFEMEYCFRDKNIPKKLPIQAVRGPFTRNVPLLLKRMEKEYERVFTEALGTNMAISDMRDTLMKMLVHCKSRQCSEFISLFPIKSLGYLLAPLVVDLKRHHRTLDSILIPEIQRRQKAAKVPGFVPPMDLLQFICELRKDNDELGKPEELVKSVNFMIFASIFDTLFHTTHFFYDIAGLPGMRARMYEEQQQIIAKHGTDFTKEALQDMTYMDACLRETLRLHTNATSTVRMAMREVTFANGLSIPARRLCFVHSRAANRCANTYEAADDYLPERISATPGMRASTTGPGYVTFGMGRTACPGRVFIVSVIKSLAAWTLRHYDFATKSGTRPKSSVQQFGDYLPTPEPILFELRNA
ncbi:cytochrome P450 [Thamnocephalis sphaerospora]|uniref:Cytochrome P450 n=1 Tax=Thamnocephalis sphaerospora TaxID=78915 RepID=A0A4P9XMK2_9FUNG|nr:cytochrome P450 [Thamnocephalis sphaerospora]|eukprot:RKP07144.1 cytochrome P450 [Thamnocephalis sphaerospora]